MIDLTDIRGSVRSGTDIRSAGGGLGEGVFCGGADDLQIEAEIAAAGSGIGIDGKGSSCIGIASVRGCGTVDGSGSRGGGHECLVICGLRLLVTGSGSGKYLWLSYQ